MHCKEFRNIYNYIALMYHSPLIQDQDQEILFQLGKTFCPKTTFQDTQKSSLRAKGFSQLK